MGYDFVSRFNQQITVFLSCGGHCGVTVKFCCKKDKCNTAHITYSTALYRYGHGLEIAVLVT